MNSHLDFLFWGNCGDSQGEALSRQKNLEIRRDVRWAVIWGITRM